MGKVYKGLRRPSLFSDYYLTRNKRDKMASGAKCCFITFFGKSERENVEIMIDNFIKRQTFQRHDKRGFRAGWLLATTKSHL